MGNRKFIGMKPATAATPEASVLHELGISAFQYGDIEFALTFMLLASADPRP
jgi:hypothetical protein